MRHAHDGDAGGVLYHNHPAEGPHRHTDFGFDFGGEDRYIGDGSDRVFGWSGHPEWEPVTEEKR